MTGSIDNLHTVSVAAVWFSLVVIVLIGANLIFQRERRRGEDRQSRQPLAVDVDPVQLRRTRPTTARLSGTVLIVAVLIIIGAFRGPLGLG